MCIVVPAHPCTPYTSMHGHDSPCISMHLYAILLHVHASVCTSGACPCRSMHLHARPCISMHICARPCISMHICARPCISMHFPPHPCTSLQIRVYDKDLLKSNFTKFTCKTIHVHANPCTSVYLYTCLICIPVQIRVYDKDVIKSDDDLGFMMLAIAPLTTGTAHELDIELQGRLRARRATVWGFHGVGDRAADGWKGAQARHSAAGWVQCFKGL